VAVSRSAPAYCVRALGGHSDAPRVGIVLAQQRQRHLSVAGRDDAAEAAAHVEDLVHLLAGDAAALLDQLEDRRYRQGVVDLVADLGGEALEVPRPPEVMWARPRTSTAERSSSSTGLT